MKGFGGGTGVFGGVEPAAEFQYPAVEFADELPSPSLMGKSTQMFQPGMGKLSGAWLRGPNSLNTLRNE